MDTRYSSCAKDCRWSPKAASFLHIRWSSQTALGVVTVWISIEPVMEIHNKVKNKFQSKLFSCRPTDWVVCVLTHCRYKSTNSYKLAKVVLTAFPKLLPINLAPSQQTNRLDRLLYNIPYKRVYPLLFQYYPEFMRWNIKAKGWKLCIAFESICKSYVRKILNCKIL